MHGAGSFPDIPEPPDGPLKLRCGGVWAWRSENLLDWARTQTDVRWSGANTRVTSVARPAARALPANLPPHMFIMATERGGSYAFNDQPDLAHGWRTLRVPEHSGVLACPAIHYAHPFYYTISGGGQI